MKENQVLSFLKCIGINNMNDLDAKRKKLDDEELKKGFWQIAIQDFFTVQSLYHDDFSRYFKFSYDMIFDRSEGLQKYCCVFPQRTIITSGEMRLLVDGRGKRKETYSIYDIAKTNLLYAKLYSQEIAYISPHVYGDVFGLESECIDTEDCPSNIIYLDDLSTTNNSYDNRFADQIFIALPWLYNADVDTYLELTEKYKNEFINYNFKLNQICKTIIGKEAFVRGVLQELNEVNVNISIALQIAQSKLKRKGIVTLLGVCFTIIPLLLPDFLPELYTKSLPVLFGGSTIYEAISLYNDMTGINEFRGNPFWIICKWREDSKHVKQ